MDSAHPALRRLSARHPSAIELSLLRMETALARLGRPQDRLPPVIHVAGTNGKGSVCAYLAAIHRAAGRRVHVYSSPHLRSWTESVVLADRPVDEAVFAEALAETDKLLGDAPITLFEAVTATAFRLFADHPADLLVLETGMGGRLDATNLVARPLVTVLAAVGLDHTEFLGPDLRAVAGEKAGILKAGAPCVAARHPPVVAAVVAARAAKLGVPLAAQGRDWEWRPDGGGGLIVCGRTSGDRAWRRCAPTPALAGDHQRDNAALALACVEAGAEALPVSDAAAAAGIAGAVWPARLQRLTTGSLAAQAAAAGASLWLDGGHNPHAACALAATLAQDSAPLGIILGMLANKDAHGFVRPLIPQAAAWRTVPCPGGAYGQTGADPQALATLLTAAGGRDVAAAETLAQALAQLLETGVRRALICGSLHLAATAL